MRPLVAPLFAGVFSLLAAACAASGPDVADTLRTPPRTAWIVAADGRAIGQATFTEAVGGVLIRLEFTELALRPGWHGLHLHQVGDCSDFAAGFRASGGHLGMGRGVQHGLRNPQGPEAGDLTNIFVPVSVPYAAELFSPHVTLAIGADNGRLPLIDGDGTALLIHAGPDDHSTQPIGGAGDRIACAALTPRP